MIFSNMLVSCADSCKQNLIFIRNVRGEIESFFILLQILSQPLSFGIYNFPGMITLAMDNQQERLGALLPSALLN